MATKLIQAPPRPSPALPEEAALPTGPAPEAAAATPAAARLVPAGDACGLEDIVAHQFALMRAHAALMQQQLEALSGAGVAPPPVAAAAWMDAAPALPAVRVPTPVRMEREAPAADPDPLPVADRDPLPATDAARPERTTPFPLTPAQRQIWVHAQLGDDASSAYNEQFVRGLRGPFDEAAFRAAVEDLMAHHESLRTVFDPAGEVQRVVPSPPVPLVVTGDAAADGGAEALAAALAREAGRALDLVAGPPFRVHVHLRGPGLHVVQLVVHHIVADGLAVDLLERDLETAYAARRAGRAPLLPPAMQFGEYAALLATHAERASSARAAWLARFEGATPLVLPCDRPRPPFPTHRAGRARHTLPASFAATLRDSSRRQGCTLFTTLLSGVLATLHRLTGQDDLVVGVPSATRPFPGAESVVGHCVDVLPLRSRTREGQDARGFLREVRGGLLDAFEHEVLSYARLREHLQVPRGPGLPPLISVICNLEPVPAAAPAAGGEPTFAGLPLAPVAGATPFAKFDLTLDMVDTGGDIHLVCLFNADLFDAGTVRRLLERVERVLAQLAADPATPLDALDLLGEAERRLVLEEWNATDADDPSTRCIHQLFEAQAEHTPDGVAVVFDNQALTYAALNERANRLAHHLRRLGVGPEVRVGVCLDRGPELVVALLAVLKAGGAYVPLDAAYPPERLAFMLGDAGVAVLLTEARLRGALPAPSGVRVVDVDQARGEIAAGSAENPRSGAGPDGLAYVMYTSGSTGTPRGVAVCHRNVVRLVRGATYADLGPGETFLQAAPVSFDASTLELWGALLNGGRLVMMPAAVPSLESLGRALVRHGVTTLWLTAGLFRAMVDERLDDLRGLRQLLAGGDVLPAEAVRRVKDRHPALRLINGYGPTENTTFTCCYTVPDGWSGGPVPIGGPISGTRAYVLDRALRPVPIGVAGELYAGGDGVARGYVGRPGATAERFVPDPFGPRPGARMYRTGDRARWREDGVLEYLGRLDAQVKVRGFRVEPGEVEAVLRRHPAVTDAAVVARRDARGETVLAAYVVGDADARTLRDHLSRLLPPHMVPAAFVALDALPLTANGKVDRRALPAPDDGAGEAGHAAPRTPVEEVLAGVWAEVLGRGRMGVDEGFFDLGGHSLLAMRVVSRVRQVFGVELALRALFETPTVAELAGAVDALRRAAQAPLPAVVPVDRAKPIPLSFAQERLWFLDRLRPQSAEYNVPHARRLRGALDVPALERALGEIVRRHEALRTTFAEVEGGPVQVIASFAGFTLPVDDLSALDEPAREAEVRRRAGEDAARPFDLAAGPLFRARLLRLADDEHVLLLCIHHVASDGWSMRILFGELAALYAAFREGRESPLPEPALQYADYAVWQREQLAGEALDRQLAYWTDRLAGAPGLLELPADHPRPAVQTYRGGHVPVDLSAELLHRLEALARGEGATLYMVLLAAFQVLLGRYGGTDDVVVGSPVAGRTRGETEGLIGFFVNTLVLRTELSGDPAFREVLRRVRETTLGAYEHQDLPFERLVAELQPERTLSHAPFFQVMFTLENAADARAGLPDLRAERVESADVGAKFDLTLSLAAHAGGIRGSLVYGTDLFERGTLERMAGHLERVLEQVSGDPGLRLSRLELLGEAERRLVVEAWNRTLPAEPCIHHRVEAWAARTPDAAAVACEGRSLSYGELDRSANRLARCLRRRGVGPDVPVGVCLERGPELVVAMLAILKAGGAYVPLDPAYPAERAKLILADCGVRVLLTRDTLRDGLPVPPGGVVAMDGDTDEILAESDEPLEGGAAARNLAYVVYTSGSTGTPRGVGVEHAGLRNMCAWHAAAFGITAADRVTQLISPGFDAAASEIWPALAQGACLQIVPEAVRTDPPALRDWLVARESTVATAPAALAEPLLALEWPRTAPLRWLITGGERLRTRPGAGIPFALANNYGPTECTVTATSARVEREGAAAPSIGRPVDNTRAYVLDAHGRPAPVGVAGELCIGGVQVARGYVGRAAQTAERFIPDPLSGDAGARLYRTGDRVRWRADGTLEFMGRLDAQVKIRGVRVEPGEVEAALRRHPLVAACAVAAGEDARGETRLVAFVVGDADADALRAHLSRHLPPHMIPAAFVTLEALPLTPNGKVDRRALPMPDEDPDHDRYVAPRTPAEEVLAGIWAEVLGRGRVGVDESFFDLGGHSLLATRAASRIRAAFGVEVPLRALFEHPTVAGLAERVEALRRAGLPRLPAVSAAERTGPIPLSFAQERLWFLDRLQPGSAFYNIPEARRFAGPLDARALERALGEIVRRHEALRTTFAEVEGAPVQVIAPFAGFTLGIDDLSALDEPAREAEVRRRAAGDAARPFDLAAGPLFRARLLRLADDEHVLLLCIHHVASDGWSMRILFGELAALYAAFRDGRESPLAEPALQYADYAVWQRAQLAGEALDRQLAYWTDRLAGAPGLLELPADHPRPAVQTYRGGRVPVDLSAELLERLQALARGEGATLYMVLLAAFQVLLGRYGGTDDVVVGSPVAGRTRGETEGLIGFFVNTLVLRTELSGDPAFREVLRRVRETTLGAYEHQDLPFERLVAELQPERTLSHSPLFQAMFALADADGPAGALPGLRARGVAAGADTTRFDVMLQLAPHAAGIRGLLQYSTDLFERATVERMLEHLARLLEQVAADPDRPLSAVELMAPAERTRVVDAWSGAGAVFPVSIGLHQRFEAQAAARPHAVAVTCGGDSLTYAALNARANRLARRLRARGVAPESRVGLCAERSLDLLVGILAILKAGGAYVPLDPAYPAERLAYMASDSGIRVLLTQSALRDRVPADGIAVVSLDDDAADESGADLGVSVDPSSLAYVIYTSGSSGRPKGVGVTHGNVLRLFAATDAGFGFGAEDVWTLFHSCAFDFSVWEIWGALLHGGRLVVVPFAVSRDPAAFLGLLERERVTVLNQTPSAFRALAQADEDAGGRAELALRTVVFGGEALDPGSLRGWMARRGDVRPQLVNMYGITETTVHVTHRVLREADVQSDSSSQIGIPIADLRTYVLDAAGHPVPAGVPGELHVGGAGLARGYLGRPALTAERFVPDPFGAEPGARLYRSGDRARWRADGTLAYGGRIDQQVKVRGFRIEPGEIEAVLRAHPGVQDAVVIDYEHAPGDRRLAAYVVPDAERASAPRRLLELERTGALAGHRLETLPDGTEVVSINPQETRFLYQEIMERGAYLGHGITLPPDACVFDVGANIGLFTVAVSRRCPRGRVYAFEPIPPVAEALRLNAAVHGGDVGVMECGLGEAEDEVEFTFYPNASVLSGRHAEPAEERAVIKAFLLNEDDAAGEGVAAGLDALLEQRLSTRRFTCRLRTLSQVMREEGVERIDLLKVDVEKSEMEVLAGIEDGDWAKIRQVAVEVHDTDGRLERVRALLETHGFGVVAVQDAAMAGTGLHELYAVRPGEVASASDPGAEDDGRWHSAARLVQDLRGAARERLPEHMVPAVFIPIDRVPLTANGKVDRGRLPRPAEQGSAAAAFTPPVGGMEERLAELWREVLGVERVGRHDGFFDLGGHSLLLARLHARLRETLGREVPVVDLFRFPTVAALAEHLGAQGDGAAAPRPGAGSERAAVRRALARRRGNGSGGGIDETTGAGAGE